MELIRWIVGEVEVDGLPPLPWPDEAIDQVRRGYVLAREGHRDVITWLKRRGKIDADVGTEM